MTVSSLFAVLAASAALLALQGDAKFHIPSYRALRRDNADANLDASIKDFFKRTKQVSEEGDEEESGLITPLGNNRVKMLDDTLVSDYIEVNYWQWEADSNNTSSGDDWYDETYGVQDQLYFLMAESRNDPATDPLVIWLQGGPGCSSMLGIYTENGPFNFKYDRENPEDPFKFEYNAYSWNNNANVMYVDQPVGTGFSFIEDFGSLRWSEDSIANDFVMFLHNFMAKYPDF